MTVVEFFMCERKEQFYLFRSYFYFLLTTMVNNTKCLKSEPLQPDEIASCFLFFYV